MQVRASLPLDAPVFLHDVDIYIYTYLYIYIYIDFQSLNPAVNWPLRSSMTGTGLLLLRALSGLE